MVILASHRPAVQLPSRPSGEVEGEREEERGVRGEACAAGRVHEEDGGVCAQTWNDEFGDGRGRSELACERLLAASRAHQQHLHSCARLRSVGRVHSSGK